MNRIDDLENEIEYLRRNIISGQKERVENRLNASAQNLKDREIIEYIGE